jgi:hypothetical protein
MVKGNIIKKISGIIKYRDIVKGRNTDFLRRGDIGLDEAFSTGRSLARDFALIIEPLREISTSIVKNAATYVFNIILRQKRTSEAKGAKGKGPCRRAKNPRTQSLISKS